MTWTDTLTLPFINFFKHYSQRIRIWNFSNFPVKGTPGRSCQRKVPVERVWRGCQIEGCWTLVFPRCSQGHPPKSGKQSHSVPSEVTQGCTYSVLCGHSEYLHIHVLSPSGTPLHSASSASHLLGCLDKSCVVTV